MGFFESIIAGLIVAGITGGTGYVWGKRNAEKEFTQKQKVAVQRFGEELKKLIDKAEPNADDAIIMARSIVSVRDSLRKTLTGLAGTLNSDIDFLSEVLGDGTQDVENIDAVRERLSILKETWPAKVSEMDVSVRKLLTELGLYPK